MIRHLRRIALGVALVFVIAWPLRSETAVPTSAAIDPAIFNYEQDRPFDLTVIDSATREGALVRDVTFVAIDRPIKAYIVSPAEAAGSVAAVLYVHWLGSPSTSNRTEFLNEAVALADRGIVSLLVDAMWAEPKWYQNRIPEEDYARGIRQIIELRRALDLLLLQPNVDVSRVAFVGHDFGAMYGAVMGAIDRRPTTYVLMAGAPRFIDWFLFARQPKDPDAYRAQLTPLDPVNFVGQLSPAPVFFQFASNDEYVPADRALEFYAAAKPRKQAATYNAGHDLQDADAAADRITWLLRQLAPK